MQDVGVVEAMPECRFKLRFPVTQYRIEVGVVHEFRAWDRFDPTTPIPPTVMGHVETIWVLFDYDRRPRALWRQATGQTVPFPEAPGTHEIVFPSTE